jgi:outer membrane protein
MNPVTATILSPRLRRCALATLVACVLMPSAAPAADLVQVFDLARQHDASMLAAEAQFRAAAPRYARAKGALLPTLSLAAAATRLRSGKTDDPDAALHADNRATSVSLNLRQPLFNAALTTDVAIADVAEQSAQLTYRIAQQDFILRVAQAYFDVLSAQDVLATRRLSKAAIDGQLDAAIRRFKSGLGIITDQEEAQARASLAQADAVGAENALRVAQLALERLTGQRAVVAQPVAAEAAATRISAGALEAWLQLAARHPSVQRGELAYASARLGTRRSRASGLPTLDLVGTAGRSRVRGEASPLSTVIPGRSNNASIGVELNLPLFAGFTRYHLVAENVALQEQAGHERDAALRAAQASAERAYFDLQTALARAQALADAEAASRSSLAGTQQGYKAGLRPNLDVLNAQAQLYQTRSELDRVRYEVMMRSLSLKAAAGQLEPASLVDLSRLNAPAP